MLPPEGTSQLCFSLRVVIPFVRLLRKLPAVPPEAVEGLDTMDPDARIPIAVVHELMTGAIHLTGDPDLGLKAAREIVPGDYGAVEYAARSAATWGDAANAAVRNRLFSRPRSQREVHRRRAGLVIQRGCDRPDRSRSREENRSRVCRPGCKPS